MISPNTLEDAKALARANGGNCLATVYKNRRSLLKWQCGLDHSPWFASYSNVMSGTWCPTCGHAVRGAIKDMHALAKSRGGKCLSDTFVNFHVPLRWRCAEGHEWSAEPNNIIGRGRKEGSWCPKCARKRARGKRPEEPTIDDMRRLASSRGGTCDSAVYINAHTRLQWICAEGHSWNAEPANVRLGSWCPYCAGKARKTLSEMQKLASTWGGGCLSATFTNVHACLTWICSTRHVFEALPRNVQRGHWCPYCARSAPGNLDQARDLAEKCGGECLSTRYVNTQSPLQWRCAKGHEWFARPCNVKSGDWCLRCYRERGGSDKNAKK
jgi:hypothetical protein